VGDRSDRDDPKTTQSKADYPTGGNAYYEGPGRPRGGIHPRVPGPQPLAPHRAVPTVGARPLPLVRGSAAAQRAPRPRAVEAFVRYAQVAHCGLPHPVLARNAFDLTRHTRRAKAYHFGRTQTPCGATSLVGPAFTVKQSSRRLTMAA
jgi:hypothetical protein